MRHGQGMLRKKTRDRPPSGNGSPALACLYFYGLSAKFRGYLLLGHKRTGVIAHAVGMHAFIALLCLAGYSATRIMFIACKPGLTVRIGHVVSHVRSGSRGTVTLENSRPSELPLSHQLLALPRED